MPNLVSAWSETLPSVSNSRLSVVQFRLAHLCRPPQARVIDIKLGKLFRRESHILRFARADFNILGKFDFLDPALQRSLYRMVGGILQQRGDREVSLVVGRRIHCRRYSGIAKRHGPAGR